MEERFATVRQILSEPPSEESWDALLKELRAWPTFENKAMAIEYLDAHLALWPDHLRALNQLNESPYWRFVRCYHVDQKMKNQTLHDRLMSYPMLESITALRISVGGHIGMLIRGIFSSVVLTQLKTLILENRKMGYSFNNDVRELAKTLRSYPDRGCELEQLMLWNIDEMGLRELHSFASLDAMKTVWKLGISNTYAFTHEPRNGDIFGEASFPALTHLYLRDAQISIEMMQRLCDGIYREQLESLWFVDISLSEEHIDAMVASKEPFGWQELYLENCALETSGVRKLLMCKALKGATVYISRNSLHQKTAESIERRQREGSFEGPEVVLGEIKRW